VSSVRRAAPRPLAAAPWRPFTLRERVGLIWEIAASYARVRWWLRRRTVEQVAHALRRGRRLAGADGTLPRELLQLSWRLGRLVERGLERLPGDTRCLTRSLVLVRMLAERGIHSTLVIGVKSEPEFAAHAWVEVQGRAMLEPSDYAQGRLAEF